MAISYTSLMNVIFAHPYFGNDRCPVVDLIPTSKTYQAMNALQIRILTRESGIELFIGSADGQPIGLETIGADEVVQLFFILRATDPAFLNYTDLPISEGSLNQIAYLTNLEGNDLSLDSENRYPLEALVTNHDGLKPGDLGLLSIYLEKGAGARNDITVNFASRATFWRYFIIDSVGLFDPFLFITDQEGDASFFTPEAQNLQLSDGNTAKVLTSTRPLFLQQRYSSIYQLNLLQHSESGAGRHVTLPLPYANATNINYEKTTAADGTEKHRFYSDIYVYL